MPLFRPQDVGSWPSGYRHLTLNQRGKPQRRFDSFRSHHSYNIITYMKFVCTKCHAELDEGEFTCRSNGKRYAWCKGCKKEYNERYYNKNSERHCAYVGAKRERKVHKCKHCGRSEPKVTFYRRRESMNGTPRFICRECDVLYRKRFPKYSIEAKRGHNQRRRDKQSAERKQAEFAAKYVLADCKEADRKKKRDNDLTLEFIRDLISHGCKYCGTVELRISLDRINNSLGHLQSNVNACCRRCNWLRRDMPYEAWLRLVPTIKQIAVEGLFGDWHAGPNRHAQVKEEMKQLRLEVSPVWQNGYAPVF